MRQKLRYIRVSPDDLKLQAPLIQPLPSAKKKKKNIVFYYQTFKGIISSIVDCIMKCLMQSKRQTVFPKRTVKCNVTWKRPAKHIQLSPSNKQKD